ncbi:MmgE/PrpD family protein [Desulfotalea psychrophila]|uniref:MmgE/PrpD family protein n=1 Tax=Desulfotalea psychrophila (strain LSv54 / DSM 12343) TaxID=177439 RepID=Q6ANA7_DESPS|nr:MmgE/PrpD family protein [Desulfotalea psychrophila]CAG36167.1 conserved hypothetical protein [Desulfotalea psychrophila LSv54]
MNNTEKSPDLTIAEQLAEYIVALRFEQIPFAVIDHARHLLLDLIGASLAGIGTPEACAATRAVEMLAPQGGASLIWGTDRGTTPGGAALVNGIIAHARELDDFGGVDHTGAVVVPALLAVAESFPTISGEDFIAAMVVGYEVGRRVLNGAGGYRPHNHEDGYHSTGSCGSFAAAAAVAKLLRLNVEQTTWALGLAGSFTGGTWAFTVDGAMSKRYHVGRAAETGVVTALLALNDFTGPAHIFEAEWGGFLTTYARHTAVPEALTEALGRRYDTLRSGIKPYAACRDIHSSLDVLFKACREHHLQTADITSIEVRCIPEMKQMIGSLAPPTNRFEAQLSLPYSLAVALVTGRAFLSEYEEPYLFSKEVVAAMALVVLIEDPGLPYDSEPHIRIQTRDGRSIEGHVPYASGAPQNPLEPNAIYEKFDSLALRALSAERVKLLRRTILDIVALDDVRSISDLLKIG